MLQFDPRLLSLRDFLPGQVLVGTRGARYHLRDRVGEGSQGWVFRASWDEPGGYPVVVKVLRPDAVTPESLARLQREAHVLRTLGEVARPNPHVVRFFDHATVRLPMSSGGDPLELPFTVLEYIAGPSLESVLLSTRGVGLPLDRVRRVGRQVALALEDVHAHKIVHRDLKPSNVLLAHDAAGEVAKVTDFGLAKVVDSGLGRTTSRAGATLGYAPPEQFEHGNRRVGPRTDIFSFAALLYEMLTGTKAFPHGEGENPLIVVTRLLNGPRPSLSRGGGVLPHELAARAELVENLNAVLQRATAAEPGERPATMAELWGSIEPLLRAASQHSDRPLSPVHGASAATTESATAVDLQPPPRPGAASSGSGAARSAVDRFEATAPQLSSPFDPELQYASPASWVWRVRVAPLRPGALRAAAFEPNGEGALGVGVDGVARWPGSSAAGWSAPAAPPEIDPRAVRGLLVSRPREVLLFGARSLAARWTSGAALERWTPPEGDVTFLGAHADLDADTVTMVGERPAPSAVRAVGSSPATVGVVAQFARGRLVLLADVPPCARLRGVGRLGGGGLVACGDWGSLVRLEGGAPEPIGPICGGHLHAIAGLPGGGGVTVGDGGHALSLSSRLEAQLEAVQTTRDLRTLAVGASGVAWAGSARARLLRRTRGSWVRMSAELGLSSTVVALWASPRAIRAICDDGAVIEGFVRDDHVGG